MSKKNEVVLLPVTLNGMLYSIDHSGTMAITTDGRAVRLSDPVVSNSRFR